MKSLTALLLVCCFSRFLGAPLTHDSQLLAGNTVATFAVSPQQYSNEQPVQTSLPQTFLTATTKLFEQGLPDPRGCEYRQVEILVHTIWGGAGRIITTNAWLLPESKDGKRLVIAWNGLVYPAVAVGSHANLQADVLAAIEIDEAQFAKVANTSRGAKYRFRNSVPEGHAVSHSSLLPLKASLLVRLREIELAEKVWTAWTSHMDPKVNDDALHLYDPYLMLARDWIWARFERSLCAHIRGDDALALDDASFLKKTNDSISHVIDERSSSWPAKHQSDNQLKRSYFEFLQPLPGLLADQERRLKQGRSKKTLPELVGGHKDKGDLINALVQELDQATAHQHGQPGGVDMTEDAIVQELIKHGAASVEPLLKVLEQDNRLTRSVRFHRDFGKHRHIVFVYEAAYRCLAVILRLSQDESMADSEKLSEPGLAGRKAVAARLRMRLYQGAD